jgi:hypothetical protein
MRLKRTVFGRGGICPGSGILYRLREAAACRQATKEKDKRKTAEHKCLLTKVCEKALFFEFNFAPERIRRTRIE